jgi:uncharacterized protein YjbI with pentapeptide repeats
MAALEVIGASIAAVAGVTTGAQAALEVLGKYTAKSKMRDLAIAQGAHLFGADAAEIATLHYVQPECQATDPSQRDDSSTDAPRQPVFEYLKSFLCEPRRIKHLLILAEPGMGKTSLTLNLHAWSVRGLTGRQLVAVPLGSPDADDFVRGVKDPAGKCIILDAFDEDPKAWKDWSARFYELMHATRHFHRVILTCRTQFFLRDQEIPDASGLTSFAPRASGEGAWQLERRYLSPLSTKDIGRYLRRRYPLLRFRERARARTMADLMPNLSVRPMLLSRIPELLEHREGPPSSPWELYDHLINGWAERERRFVPPDILLYFSHLLAIDIYENAELRRGEHIPSAELAQFVVANGLGSILEKQLGVNGRLLQSRSLLNRNGAGDCKFAHRSILEFLVAQSIVAGRYRPTRTTDQVSSFLRDKVNIDCLRLGPGKELFRPYLAQAQLPGVNLKGSRLEAPIMTGARLSHAILVEATLERADLNGAFLESATLNAANLTGSKLRGAQLMRAIVRDATLVDVDMTAANLSEADVSRAELRGAMMRDAKLCGADLSEAKLQGADLRAVDFTGANLTQVDFTGANLAQADFTRTILTGANFADANLADAILFDRDLRSAILRGAILRGAVLTRADLQVQHLGAAELGSAELDSADLREASLVQANLEDANLAGALLDRVVLAGARLVKANLEGATLTGANLTGANLQGARLMDADFQGATLTDANFDGAWYSSQTRFPKDFSTSNMRLWPQGRRNVRLQRQPKRLD